MERSTREQALRCVESGSPPPDPQRSPSVLILELCRCRVYAAPVTDQLPLIVSGASLLVALGSASISYASWRSSGPNVKIRAIVSKRAGGSDLTLRFRIHNRGMAPVEVKQPYVAWLAGNFEITNEDLRSGTAFPFELKPHSGGEWEASLQRPVLRRLHDPDVKELHGVRAGPPPHALRRPPRQRSHPLGERQTGDAP